MSSRGVFVGQIIDDLDAIASQVRTRCALSQFDLNRVLEDFFKELLNLIYGANLRNLNKLRQNEPGLDLGDWTSPRKIAFQVTSQADATKVKNTLKKITPKQLATYDEFFILVIGERRKSYQLDPALCAPTNFSERNIIGITELCREIMDLDIAAIQAIQQKLADEQRRIRIELEPEVNGRFATTITDLVEGRPDIRRSDASILYAHPACAGLFGTRKETEQAINGFIDELQKLPRLTRELFGWLIDNSDKVMATGSGEARTNADYVHTKWGEKMRAELRLLDAWRFAEFDRDEEHKSGWFDFYFKGAERTNLDEAFINFLIDEELSAATMFSTMNFTPFGKAKP